MIITRVIRTSTVAEREAWRYRFAFWPVLVLDVRLSDTEQRKDYVWGEWYKYRSYYDASQRDIHFTGHCEDYKRLNSLGVYTIREAQDYSRG